MTGVSVIFSFQQWITRYLIVSVTRTSGLQREHIADSLSPVSEYRFPFFKKGLNCLALILGGHTVGQSEAFLMRHGLHILAVAVEKLFAEPVRDGSSFQHGAGDAKNFFHKAVRREYAVHQTHGKSFSCTDAAVRENELFGSGHTDEPREAEASSPSCYHPHP